MKMEVLVDLGIMNVIIKIKCLLIIIYRWSTARRHLTSPPLPSPSAPSHSRNLNAIKSMMKSSLSIQSLLLLKTGKTALPSKLPKPSLLVLSKKLLRWLSIMKAPSRDKPKSITVLLRRTTGSRKKTTK